MLDRRQFLKGAITIPLAAGIHGCASPAPWSTSAYRKRARSRVAILEAASYDIRLKEILLAGLKLFRLSVRGKTVVLKPNLVEYDPAAVINTHPAVIAAAIDAFRSLGAREVVVAEGPGHRRDIEYLLTASGLHQMLRDRDAQYVDLNYEDVQPLELASRYTELRRLYFPETVLKADLLVSMPKLKTHHWAGVTLSMKNLFGVMPGLYYGWPKNVLHWAGIEESILDITATLQPHFAIADGIVGMEGDGPIMGTPRYAGVIVMGSNLPAVDATCTRIMGLNPRKIPHLARADDWLGPIGAHSIEQRGEPVSSVRTHFALLEAIPAHRELRQSTLFG